MVFHSDNGVQINKYNTYYNYVTLRVPGLGTYWSRGSNEVIAFKRGGIACPSALINSGPCLQLKIINIKNHLDTIWYDDQYDHHSVCLRSSVTCQ